MTHVVSVSPLSISLANLINLAVDFLTLTNDTNDINRNFEIDADESDGEKGGDSKNEESRANWQHQTALLWTTVNHLLGIHTKNGD